MGAGKILVIIGAILSILGTFVFALFTPAPGWIGSGIGFAVNLPDIFANADLLAALVGLEVFIIYIIIVVFIIFLASGPLQFVGLKSRVVGLIFSLFPLGVGILFILLFWTDLLGPISTVFGAFFATDLLGGAFPVFITGGGTNLLLGDLGLGAYFLVGGGLLGFIGCILPRD
ncbi:MAG: hypothetical protein ACFE96_05635 [Candidatus Hermodarchaeota archaeon]